MINMYGFFQGAGHLEDNIRVGSCNVGYDVPIKTTYLQYVGVELHMRVYAATCKQLVDGTLLVEIST